MVSAASALQAAQLGVVGAAADDVDDLAVLDADVGVVALRARAVDDGATGDLEVEHESPPSLFGVAMGWLAEDGGRETGGRPVSAAHYATPRSVNSEGIRGDVERILLPRRGPDCVRRNRCT